MSEPALSSDRGLLLADGLFETVLFRRGEPVLWPQHMDRLSRACAAVDLPPPDAAHLRTAADRAIDAAGLQNERAAVRLTWTAGSGGRGLERPDPVTPRLIVSAAPSARPDRPAVVALSAVARNEGSPASRLKTLAYLDNVLARRAARAAGADEALMLNNAGRIAGGAAANLFWIEEDRLCTPALDCGVLDGIMRAQVLAAASGAGLQAVEAHAGLDDLSLATAAAISNSLIGLRPVGGLLGRTLQEDPRLTRLIEACAVFA